MSGTSTGHVLAPSLARACAAAAPQRVGLVSAVRGMAVSVTGLDAALGEVLTLDVAGRTEVGEVVAVDGRALVVMPFGRMDGLRVGAHVRSTGGPLLIPAGPGLLGRVVNATGTPIDGRGPLSEVTPRPASGTAPNPTTRARIAAPLPLGVRVLDTLTTVGRGQRIGLFAGSGVGKSSLLSMIARGTAAPLSVIALVGERGREVREFLEDDLGPEGLARSVVVVATSDEPPMTRLKAAFTATAIAESFRDAGQDVVLMMDSLTRVAMAQREVGLSAGEPPATRGYPPSTFALLAALLERAGTGPTGSVTGIYTVLVDGDDHNEPIADAARSILDGHVVLDRKLAVAGHFPSVDALASISRVASKVVDPTRGAQATVLRKVMAAHAGARDLLDVGAYAPGANRLVDAAVTHAARIEQFLCQPIDQVVDFETSFAQLADLVTTLGVR